MRLRASTCAPRPDDQPTEPPKRVPVTEAACSHAVLQKDMNCTVVADLSTDWRFRQNPLLLDMDKKVRCTSFRVNRC